MHVRVRARWLDCTLTLCLVASCAPAHRSPAPDTTSVTESRVTESSAPDSTPPLEAAASPAPGSFGDDVAFMSEHTRIVVLRDASGARVAVAPEYQGRVMTSSAEGDAGLSFGWIHRPVIASRSQQPHMTVLGGEDRFWLGPEGGQYGLYFPPGAPFEFAHWQVPAPIDWGPFSVLRQNDQEIAFEKSMQLVNHSGTRFELSVRRTVRLLAPGTLGLPTRNDLHVVAFETENVIKNTGQTAWTKHGGLLSIWILGMFRPSDTTTLIFPVQKGPAKDLGPAVRDDYFGAIPRDRLRANDSHVFFRGDGKQRGKIGIPRARALPSAGSYDAARGVLTLVQFTLPDTPRDYVDSRWQWQSSPYDGDVSNGYNDGPPAPSEPPLGPFYEIESSSPAVELGPGQSLEHRHRTIHLAGERSSLDASCRAALGVSLEEVEHAFEGSAP